ncbi:MAG: molybdenum cofactor guanylyltransferase [Butyricicoccus sp.]|nr:molybdenum cofactor guanylyltransferase [Butyricicoccus sp.]
MIAFFSRRNQVYPTIWQGRAAVEKHFSCDEDRIREAAAYQALGETLPHPALLFSGPGRLVTEYSPYPTLLGVLELQEHTGPSPAPWIALCEWLRQCQRLCGLLPAEGNLRNFLWDAGQGRILGLDLEDLRPIPLEKCIAMLIASLTAYPPLSAPGKLAASVLASGAMVSEEALASAKADLDARRKHRDRMPHLSGIVLAGGMSRRMGMSKAALSLSGKTLLAWQIEKLQALGIRDILLSGENCPQLPGTRTISDELPHRGPLGGLYSCLRAAEAPHCLVLSVDTPLIPCSALAKLCRAHAGNVTVLRHSGILEPLIGVYDSALHTAILPLITGSGAPVKRLLNIVEWSAWDYAGPAQFLANANTPQELDEIASLAEAYAQCGLHRL